LPLPAHVSGLFATLVGIVDLDVASELVDRVALAHDLHQLLLDEPGGVPFDIDLAHGMIDRNDFIEAELVEKLALIALQPPHHRMPPPLMWCAYGTIVRDRPQPTFATKSAGSGHAQGKYGEHLRQPLRTRFYIIA
jgi:hypothetical protein